MPTLSLFDWSPGAAGASHHVRAPGGYEVWRFAAHDPATQTWMAASFQYGFACHKYLRRYMRYRAWPTRFAPPLPQEYPAVSISIYSNNHLTRSTVRLKSAPSMTGAESGIHFGQYAFDREQDGAIHLRAPRIDLIFRPTFSRDPIEIFEHPERERHRWVLTDGLCNVSGTLELGQKHIRWAGTGFHDQGYGAAPLPGNSFLGHLFFKDRAVAFKQVATMYVATFGIDSLQLEEDAVAAAPRAHTAWGLSYPRAIKFKQGLVMNRPRVINSRPAFAHVLYEAKWCGEMGSALCEISAPSRLGWSVLGGLGRPR